MIPAGAACSYSAARRVYERKSIWMVDYLRARRSGDRLKAYFRRMHFAELKREASRRLIDRRLQAT